MYLGYCLNSYALAPRYILERKIHQNHITVWRLEINSNIISFLTCVWFESASFKIGRRFLLKHIRGGIINFKGISTVVPIFGLIFILKNFGLIFTFFSHFFRISGREIPPSPSWLCPCFNHYILLLSLPIKCPLGTKNYDFLLKNRKISVFCSSAWIL